MLHKKCWVFTVCFLLCHKFFLQLLPKLYFLVVAQLQASAIKLNYKTLIISYIMLKYICITCLCLLCILVFLSLHTLATTLEGWLSFFSSFLTHSNDELLLKVVRITSPGVIQYNYTIHYSSNHMKLFKEWVLIGNIIFCNIEDKVATLEVKSYEIRLLTL